MDPEEIRNACLQLPLVSEDFPFDESTLVFRIGGKIFALLPLDDPSWVNLKCEPEYAVTLREQSTGVKPGYHMNKKHWNSVSLNGELDNQMIIELIRHSYDLVYNSLPKKIKLAMTGATE